MTTLTLSADGQPVLARLVEIQMALESLARDVQAHESVKLAPVTDRIAPLGYFDFAAKKLLRRDADPCPLPDNLHVRLLEEVFRKRRGVSPVNALLLPRMKIKQTGDVGAVGDPSSASRHDANGLRDFLGLVGTRIRINTEDGRVRAKFDRQEFRSNVVDAANLAREAATQLSSSRIVEAQQSASQALVFDPDCYRAAAVLVKVAQQGIVPLKHEDILRTELALARRIVVSAATILRLKTKLSSPFKEIPRAHQRALNFLNWSERTWCTLRSLAPPGIDGFRKTLAAVSRFAVVAGRGEGVVDLRDLASAPLMVSLANDLLAGRLNRNDRDRPAIIPAVIADIVRLILIYGVLPAAIAEDAFVADLRDFVDRRIDWPSMLGRNDRRSVEFDDEVFEPDEDDPHLQRSHRGPRRRQRVNED